MKHPVEEGVKEYHKERLLVSQIYHGFSFSSSSDSARTLDV